MNLLPKSLVFVDVETTGGRAVSDRITELGIVRVEDGEVVEEWETLLNPQTRIPEFISSMTGITQEMVDQAPTFREVKKEVGELLEGAVFVAHNARFDYGFVKNEFRREGILFSSELLCTVRLLREMMPGRQRYGLDAAMSMLGLECAARHRALGDARVVWEIYRELSGQFEEEELALALRKLMKTPSLPAGLEREVVDAVSEAPGVYLFYGKQDELLYVGKSKDLRDRVRGHFNADYGNRTDQKIAAEIARIETIETAGEVGALIRESRLVKARSPLFNQQLRYARKLVVAKRYLDDKGFWRVKVEEVEQIGAEELEDVVGTFRSRKAAKEELGRLADEHRLCLKLLELEKGTGACFAYHLEKCRGACVGEEEDWRYNVRFLEAFKRGRILRWPFGGAVAFAEEFEDCKETHVVDQWCYVGSLVHHKEEVILGEGMFDMDVYKILKRHLLKKGNIEKIRVLKDVREVLWGYVKG